MTLGLEIFGVVYTACLLALITFKVLWGYQSNITRPDSKESKEADTKQPFSKWNSLPDYEEPKPKSRKLLTADDYALKRDKEREKKRWS